jgi:hypothetical protein
VKEVKTSSNLSVKAIRNTPHALRIGSWLIATGLLLTGIGSAFLPWVWRESVALQLTGPGLAEFVKFLPQVRALQIELNRLHFLLPLFVSMLALPLFAENKALNFPTWLRWLMRLAVFPFALAAISPVWKPGVLIAEEFRLQTILAVTAMGLAVIAPLLKNIPLKVLAGLFVVAGVTAILLPIQQFALTQTGISEAYNQTVHLGWGWWLTAIGIVMAITGSLMIIFIKKEKPDEN